tara:strand:+ start:2014 stop:2247 length:234 start_codon:yes stop_codon:yes gene_type:complete
MQVTYELKVFKNVADNHKHDSQYTIFIKKNNDSFYNRYNAISEAIKKVKSINNFADNIMDFNYCTYNASIKNVTLKY